jgi:hypothetical protein
VRPDLRSRAWLLPAILAVIVLAVAAYLVAGRVREPARQAEPERGPDQLWAAATARGAFHATGNGRPPAPGPPARADCAQVLTWAKGYGAEPVALIRLDLELNLPRTAQLRITGLSTRVLDDVPGNPVEPGDRHIIGCTDIAGLPPSVPEQEEFDFAGRTGTTMFMPRAVGGPIVPDGVRPLWRDGTGQDSFPDPVLVQAGSRVRLPVYLGPELSGLTDAAYGEYHRIAFELTVTVELNGVPTVLPVAGGPFPLHYSLDPNDPSNIGGRRYEWVGGQSDLLSGR